MPYITTIRELKRSVQRFGMTARKTPDGDEVRIAFSGPVSDTEASAYYGSLDDLDDCYETARTMYAHKHGIPHPKFMPFSHYVNAEGELVEKKHNGISWLDRKLPNLRVGTCPLRSTYVRAMAELREGDFVELSAQYGDSHSASMMITKINRATFKAIEIMGSYGQGTLWTVSTNQIVDPNKGVKFYHELMSIERLRAIEDGRR